eukprot:symbB.v1.2.011656.t2/scaffold789.1/size230748/17
MAERDETHWVESLGFLKDFEVRRRASFAEWLEGFKLRLSVEKRRLTSKQLLVAQVKAQLRERAELDEEVSKRISKSATRQLARSEDWCSEDCADADFLSSVQLQVSEQLAQVSKAFKILLENSEAFKDMETLSRDGFKSVFLAEQILREAQAKDAECLQAWQKHEALCKKQLASEDLTGLWSSESSYRKSVSKFIDAAESSHQKAAGLARQLREESERYRALSKRVLSDVACCTATCYNTLARTANEANPYRHTAEQTPLPSLPSWEPLELPRSALTLKDSMVERPQGILRHWQSCRLLLTKEGSVYCYDGDMARNSPVWSGRPGEGASLMADTAAQTLTLYPAREWLKQRWSLRELSEWEQLLRSKSWQFTGEAAESDVEPLQSGEATVQPDDVGDVEPVELEPGDDEAAPLRESGYPFT